MNDNEQRKMLYGYLSQKGIYNDEQKFNDEMDSEEGRRGLWEKMSKGGSPMSWEEFDENIKPVLKNSADKERVAAAEVAAAGNVGKENYVGEDVKVEKSAAVAQGGGQAKVNAQVNAQNSGQVNGQPVAARTGGSAVAEQQGVGQVGNGNAQDNAQPVAERTEGTEGDTSQEDGRGRMVELSDGTQVQSGVMSDEKYRNREEVRNWSKKKVYPMMDTMIGEAKAEADAAGRRIVEEQGGLTGIGGAIRQEISDRRINDPRYVKDAIYRMIGISNAGTDHLSKEEKDQWLKDHGVVKVSSGKDGEVVYTYSDGSKKSKEQAEKEAWLKDNDVQVIKGDDGQLWYKYRKTGVVRKVSNGVEDSRFMQELSDMAWKQVGLDKNRAEKDDAQPRLAGNRGEEQETEMSEEEMEGYRKRYSERFGQIVGEVQEDIRDRLKMEYMPVNELDYVFWGGLRDQITGRMVDALLDKAAGSSQLRAQLRAEAESDYLKGFGGLAAATMGGMRGALSMMDPAFGVSGMGGRLIGKGIGYGVGAIIAKAGGKTLGKAAVKYLPSVVSSGWTFGNYDLMGGAIQQYADGKWDAGELVGSWLEGAKTGAVIGSMNGVTKGVADGMAKRWQKGVTHGVGFGAELGYFSGAEWKGVVDAELAKKYGQEEMDKWSNEEYMQKFGEQSSEMGIGEGAKVVGKQIVMLGILKAKGHHEEEARRLEQIQGMFTPEQRAELQPYMKMITSKKPVDKKSLELNREAKEAGLDVAEDVSGEERLAEYKKFMEDKKVSAKAKQLVTYMMFGERVDLNPVMKVEMPAADENGVINVISYDAEGNLIEKKSFRDINRATEEWMRADHERQLNQIKVNEDGLAEVTSRLSAAMQQVMKEENMSEERIAGIMNGTEGMVDGQRAGWAQKIVDRVNEVAKQMTIDEGIQTIADIRQQVLDETGVDVDEAMGSRFVDRKKKEAINKYEEKLEGALKGMKEKNDRVAEELRIEEEAMKIVEAESDKMKPYVDPNGNVIKAKIGNNEVYLSEYDPNSEFCYYYDENGQVQREKWENVEDISDAVSYEGYMNNFRENALKRARKAAESRAKYGEDIPVEFVQGQTIEADAAGGKMMVKGYDADGNVIVEKIEDDIKNGGYRVLDTMVVPEDQLKEQMVNAKRVKAEAAKQTAEKGIEVKPEEVVKQEEEQKKAEEEAAKIEQAKNNARKVEGMVIEGMSGDKSVKIEVLGVDENSGMCRVRISKEGETAVEQEQPVENVLFVAKSGQVSYKVQGGLVRNDIADNMNSFEVKKIDAIGSQIGKRIVLVNSEDMEKLQGDAGALGSWDGNGTIYLNVDALNNGKKLARYVLGHEVTHVLRAENDAAVWDAFAKSVKKYMGDSFKHEFDLKRARYDEGMKKMGKRLLSDDEIEEEVISDWAALHTLNDSEFARELLKDAEMRGQGESMYRRIMNWIEEMILKISKAKVYKKTDNEEQLKALNEARNMWMKMYDEVRKGVNGEKENAQPVAERTEGEIAGEAAGTGEESPAAEQQGTGLREGQQGEGNGQPVAARTEGGAYDRIPERVNEKTGKVEKVYEEAKVEDTRAALMERFGGGMADELVAEVANSKIEEAKGRMKSESDVDEKAKAYRSMKYWEAVRDYDAQQKEVEAQAAKVEEAKKVVDGVVKQVEDNYAKEPKTFDEVERMVKDAIAGVEDEETRKKVEEYWNEKADGMYDEYGKKYWNQTIADKAADMGSVKDVLDSMSADEVESMLLDLGVDTNFDLGMQGDAKSFKNTKIYKRMVAEDRSDIGKVIDEVAEENRKKRDEWREKQAYGFSDEAQVKRNNAGEIVEVNGNDGSVKYSLTTYDEDVDGRGSGRKRFHEYLAKQVKKGVLDEDMADEMARIMEEQYEEAKRLADSGEYPAFADWSVAPVKKDKWGNVLYSVVKSNGEYGMNLDFSLVCKKRRPLDATLNLMVARGLVESMTSGNDDLSIAKINDILRKHGFETACKLCFVDAKRFRQAKIADDFVNLYNGLVNRLVPRGSRIKVKEFGFGRKGEEDNDQSMAARTGGGEWLDEMDEAVLENGIERLKQISEKEKNSVMGKIARHLLAHPEDRKLVKRSDFMSSVGFDAVAAENPEIMKLYNAKKGNGGAKVAESDVQYLNDVSQRGWRPDAAYKVGGVRIQSFSDFVPHMIFDYLQMFADLAAGKLPAHSYTKEKFYVWAFGRTGVKINMSLVPKVVKGGIAAGLDKDGNYAWQEGETFDYDDAVAIQNTEGYRENCGTIAVGISDEHIRKMMADPNIRMIIPYHKSGINKKIAVHNNIDKFTDYTNSQNTRYSTGKKIDKKDAAKEKSFEEYLEMTGDPKKAAEAYINDCNKKGWMPKFSQFLEKTANGYKYVDGYYKLLEDFVTYVPNEEGGFDYYPQREVRMDYPKAGDAFGGLEDIMRMSLREDSDLAVKMEKEVAPVVDEIERELGLKGKFMLDDGDTSREDSDKKREAMEDIERSCEEAAKQDYGSAGTSINGKKLPSGFNLVDSIDGWKEGSVNLDMGGGKFDNATEMLAGKGVENLVFDPFNRSEEHNKKVAERVQEGGVDTAICNNCLNVINTKGARSNVILQCAKALKEGGTAYFTIYEGDGKGIGRITKDKENPIESCWQEHRKTADYLDEIAEHFDDVELKGKLIIAREPNVDGKVSIWNFDSSFEKNAKFMFSEYDEEDKYEEVGERFKNYSGTDLRRGKVGKLGGKDVNFPVGKVLSGKGGGQVYVHKNYVTPEMKDVMDRAESALPEGFEYNCVMYDTTKPEQIRFDEAAGFDTEREPVVGRMITIDLSSGDPVVVRDRFEPQIWHHKWMWVGNDYEGFNVKKAYDWSRWFARQMKENPNGRKEKWEDQLRRFGLPLDGENPDPNGGGGKKADGAAEGETSPAAEMPVRGENEGWVDYAERLDRWNREQEGKAKYMLDEDGEEMDANERRFREYVEKKRDEQVRSRNFKKWFGDWEKDPEGSSKVVDEEGKPMVMYHGSGNYGFTIFDTGLERDKDKSNVGSHFGDKGTADEFGDEDSMYAVYLDIKKPFETFDFFADIFDNVYMDVLRDLSSEIGTEEADKMLDKIMEIYPEIDPADFEAAKEEGFLNVFGDDEGLVRDTKDGYSEKRNKLVKLLKDMLKLGGYDGMRYQNWYEGDGKQDCWVVLDPEQVKSASVGDEMENSGKFDRKNKDIRYMFAGEEGMGRYGFDSNQMARRMELEMLEKSGKEDLSDEEKLRIKMATGWERGKDQQWRYEVDDFNVDKSIWDELVKSGNGHGYPLGDLFDWGSMEDKDGLLDMYPALRNVPVVINKEMGYRAVTYSYKDEGNRGYKYMIAINPKDLENIRKDIQEMKKDLVDLIMGNKHAEDLDYGFIGFGGMTDGLAQRMLKDKLEDLKDEEERLYERFNRSLAHEVQHVIQYEEGFDDGTTEVAAGSDMAYRKKAGEVEARNTARRYGMSENDRRSTLASDTEDVGRDEQWRSGDEGIGEAAGESRYMLDEGASAQKMEEQQKSENFKRWFGDWEKDRKGSSKVVDRDGKPLVMSHNTDNEFNVFDKERIGTGQGQAYLGVGFNFSRGGSSVYGKNEKRVYLDIKHPMTSDKVTLDRYDVQRIIRELNATSTERIEDSWGSMRDAVNALLDYAEGDLDIYATLGMTYYGDNKNVMEVFKKHGFDGTIEYDREGNVRNAVVFEPEQIKSADVVTYDDNGKAIPDSERFSEKDDIRYMLDDSPANIGREQDRKRREDVDEMGFYSPAERAVRGVKQEKGTGEQWLKMIEKAGGLKKEEDKWMGLSDWLRGKKSVTKDEVLEYIRENSLEMEEVRYEEGKYNKEFLNLVKEMGAEEAWDKMVEKYGEEFEKSFDKDMSIGEEWLYIGDDGSVMPNDIDNIRLDYTTEGLKDKKEIALVMPDVDPYNEDDNIHFGDAGEGRAVAWCRFGDYVDGDGKRVLVIDEIQSKRHQDGRERGYKEGWKQKRYDFVKEMTEKYGSDDALDWDLTDEERERYDNIRARQMEDDKRIPDAPYQKNWHELVMKRMLRYAAENGYDRVAWTDGRTQAERYNIGGKVKEIHEGIWNEQGENSCRLINRSGETIAHIGYNREGVVSFCNENTGFIGRNLSEVVGKDLAEKLIGSKFGGRTINAGEMMFGGEGMKGFYDQMLPRWMNKYGKKWGVQVEKMFFEGLRDRSSGYEAESEDGRKGLEMWSVPVSEEMRRSVMEEGQSRYMLSDGGEGDTSREDGSGRRKRKRGAVDVGRMSVEKRGRRLLEDGALDWQDHVLISMGGGAKFRWEDSDGSRGLGAESTGRSSEKDRKILKKAGMIDERNGETPDEMAHRIWESMPEEMQAQCDVQQIKDEILENVRSYGDHKSMLEAAEKVHFDNEKDELKRYEEEAKERYAREQGYESYEELAKAERDAYAKRQGYDGYEHMMQIRRDMWAQNNGYNDYAQYEQQMAQQNAATAEIARQKAEKDRRYDEMLIQNRIEAERDRIYRTEYLEKMARKRWLKEKGYESMEDYYASKRLAAEAARKRKKLTEKKKAELEAKMKEYEGEFEYNADGMPEAPEYSRSGSLDEYLDKMDKYNEVLRLWSELHPEHAKAHEESRRIVQRAVNKALSSDSVGDMGKRELNKIMTAVRTAKADNLSDVVQDALRAVNKVVVRSQQEKIDKLLKMKVQDMNGKNMSIAKNVDDATRRIVEKLREFANGDHDLEGTKEAIDKLYDKMDRHVQRMSERAAEGDTSRAAEDPTGENTWTEEDSETLAALQVVQRMDEGKATQRDLDGIEDQLAKAKQQLDDLSAAWADGEFAGSREQYMAKRRYWRNRIKALNQKASSVSHQRIQEQESLLNDLSELIEGGKNSLKDKVENEQARRLSLLNGAFGDINGSGKRVNVQEAGQYLHEKWYKKIFTAALSSFEYMAQSINTRGLGRDGYIYRYFVSGKDGVVEANNVYSQNMRANIKTLDNKCEEIYGKGKTFAKVTEQNEKVVQHTGIYVSDPNDPDHPEALYEMAMSKGQATYAYMVWKMKDGQAQLRLQGFSDQTIDEIKDFIGDQNVQWADWVQKELLGELRERYNDKYVEMYNTSLAEVENYVPLKRVKEMTRQDSDLSGNSRQQSHSLVEKAGSLINRRNNDVPVALTNSAFDVVFEHINQMEEWNAFAKVRKDLDYLLGSAYFRNQMNRNSKGAFERFEKAAEIAAHAERRTGGSNMDEVIATIQKGLVGAPIAYRNTTALKQMLSVPAFLGYSQDPRFVAAFLKNVIGQYGGNAPAIIGNMVTFGTFGKRMFKNRAEMEGRFRGAMTETIGWCMNNVPDYYDRVNKMHGGDSSLDDTLTSKIGKIIDKYLEQGMISNQMVDAVTCAIGIKTIYDFKMARVKDMLKKMDLTPEARKSIMEEEHRKAVMEATIYYNGTQQSNHKAFLSPMQVSKTMGDRMMSVYQNASIGFARRFVTALQDMKRLGDWNRQVRHYTRRLMENANALGNMPAGEAAGTRLTEEQARTMAQKYLRRELRHKVVEAGMYGFLMNFIWDLGGKGLLGLFRDDDNEEDKIVGMISDPKFLTTLPARGTMGTNVIGTMINGKEVGNILLNELGNITQDFKNINEKYGIISPEMAWFVLNHGGKMIGWDPKVWANTYIGFEDMVRDGNWKDGDRRIIDLMYLMNSPESNRKQVAKELYKDRPEEEYMEAVKKAARYAAESNMWEGWLAGMKSITAAEEKKLIKEFLKKNASEEEKQTMKENEEFDKKLKYADLEDMDEMLETETNVDRREKILKRYHRLNKELHQSGAERIEEVKQELMGKEESTKGDGEKFWIQSMKGNDAMRESNIKRKQAEDKKYWDAYRKLEKEGKDDEAEKYYEKYGHRIDAYEYRKDLMSEVREILNDMDDMDEGERKAAVKNIRKIEVEVLRK